MSKSQDKFTRYMTDILKKNTKANMEKQLALFGTSTAVITAQM